MNTITRFLLLIFSLNTATYAQNFNKTKLDSFFLALNAKQQTMGSIAIAEKGIVVYQKAVGHIQANENAMMPANIKSKYRIGSITKMFTSTMIFQFIDEGKLSLATSLAEYYPQLPNANKITIGDMLNHRSGLHNFTNDSLYATYMGIRKSEAEMAALFAQQKPDFEPGEKAEYSNTNYVLLGYIIEKLSGKSYSEALDKRVVSKIGLSDTYYGTKVSAAKNEASSYNYTNQWKQVPETDMSIPAGAGAIVSTPADLVKFITALFEGKLISPASLELMKTVKDRFGMGIFSIPFEDKWGYGHNGGIDGFSSLLVYFPTEKVAISYLSNGARYSTNEVVLGALSIYFNRPYIIPEFKVISLATTDLDKYLGTYSSTQIPLKITITKENTSLFAQATGQSAFPLEAKGEHKFVFAAAGISLTFDPIKSNFSLLQGGKTYLFTKAN